MESFYTLSVDKNRHFLTPSPPHLVHVVIECPLSMILKGLKKKIKNMESRWIQKMLSVQVLYYLCYCLVYFQKIIKFKACKFGKIDTKDMDVVQPI